MSKIGYGYGSEWHLLRYLGYHRDLLIDKIEDKTKLTNIKIEDQKFKVKGKYLSDDEEYGGIDFLDDINVIAEWKKFWPITGTPPKWDAVAVSEKDNNDKTYILIEAKAHIEEMKSDCKAKSIESLEKIDNALEWTKNVLEIKTNNNWKKLYYQYANRIAVQKFLEKEGIRSYILNIYFCGERDQFFSVGDCPADEKEWEEEIKKKNAYLGLYENKLNWYYDLFLPINSKD